MRHQRALAELGWLLACFLLAMALVWALYSFAWPSEPEWAFYSPYSLYTLGPWPLVLALAMLLFCGRLFVRRMASGASSPSGATDTLPQRSPRERSSSSK